MLAMMLIVVMPAISRSLPTTGPMPGIDDACPFHLTEAKHPALPDSPADSTERCGYCVLLNHNALLASGKVLHLLPVAPSPSVPVLARADDAYASPILSAPPRGPPLIG
ncbi:DUF2946 family protein [Dyella humicola]|uniref:DUF2946 family protein n=1 Tax=Dyella humicola TaxID=2992126 RepID=UPI00225AB6B3|nr:DUF2946 family protein [Dyella humicola]